MPTIIYSRSGDEFTVTAPYATVVEQLHTARDTLCEFTLIWWIDPEKASVDEDWPMYRETLATLDLREVVAVERVEGKQAEVIERARQYEAEAD